MMTANGARIEFSCGSCGRAFSVPVAFAGRKATCKTCGHKIVVPNQAEHGHEAATTPSVAAMNDHAPTPTSAPAPIVAGSPVADAAVFSKAPPVESPVSAPPAAEVESDEPAPLSEDVVPGDDTISSLAEPLAAESPELIDEPVETIATEPEPIDETPAEEQSVSPELTEPVVSEAQTSPAVVPEPAVAKPTRIPPRQRRLMADAEEMKQSFPSTGPIRVKSSVGDPPELYQIEYRIDSLQKGWFGKPKKRDTHLVEIQLISDYPRLSPKCRMLTPVFHPNIDETTVCVGDHWTAGERLVDLVVRIGEMLAYQAYNIKSPLNGEAAMWADLNAGRLPTDTRSFTIGAQQ